MTQFFKAVVQLEFALATSSNYGGFPFDGDFKCHFCKICNGFGCKNALPGMGGVNQSQNFILNCSAWSNFYEKNPDLHPKIDSIKIETKDIGIAPVTGAVQNIGFKNERDFYLPYVQAAKNAGATICIGDGAPDEKLLFGLDAVTKLDTNAYFFLKPYPNNVLFERIDWVKDRSLAIGIDIDAYNIVTMRNQVSLERKTETQLKELRTFSKLPLMIKGVFTKADIDLCKAVLPEIIVISNHGGRVQTDVGSTADFLQNYGSPLSNYCDELWVDGGIRTAQDVKVAKYLGAEKILAARPFISALVQGGCDAMEEKIRELGEKK